MQTYYLTICGLDISFNTSADADRVERATQLIQQSYNALQIHGNQLGRDRLLAILAIGIADDLLQLQEEHQQIVENTQNSGLKNSVIEERVEKLLAKIQEFV